MAIEKCINEYVAGGSFSRKARPNVVLDGKVDSANTDGASWTVMVLFGCSEFFDAR